MPIKLSLINVSGVTASASPPGLCPTQTVTIKFPGRADQLVAEADAADAIGALMSEVVPPGRGVIEEQLTVEVRKATVPTLDLIDLPGIVAASIEGEVRHGDFDEHTPPPPPPLLLRSVAIRNKKKARHLVFFLFVSLAQTTPAQQAGGTSPSVGLLVDEFTPFCVETSRSATEDTHTSYCFRRSTTRAATTAPNGAGGRTSQLFLIPLLLARRPPRKVRPFVS